MFVPTSFNDGHDDSPRVHVSYVTTEIHGALPQYPVLHNVVGDNQQNYNAHMFNYTTNYEGHMTWADYCDWQARTWGYYQPHRHGEVPQYPY